MHTRIAYSTLWLRVMILSSLRIIGAVDWCSLKCRDGSENTMCKYKPVSGIGNCTSIRESTTPTIRREMLELHNMYRNALAGGSMPGWPKAADMRYMTWDGDLEQLGLRWAMQCVAGHDQCRRTPAFEFTGQNYGMIGNTAFHPSSNISFRGWVDELKLTTSAMVTSFQVGKWGHFTQVGWANSSRLGCGEIQYTDGDMKKTTIVCNYGPAGNIVSLGMYTEGEPCSKCPSGTSCQKDSVYPNLCTTTNDVVPRDMQEILKDVANISERLSNVAPAPGGAQSYSTHESLSAVIVTGFIAFLFK